MFPLSACIFISCSLALDLVAVSYFLYLVYTFVHAALNFVFLSFTHPASYVLYPASLLISTVVPFLSIS